MSRQMLRVDVPLRHGFTYNQVQDLASSAAWNYTATRSLDIDDRLETAWFGIVERLYASDEAPSARELGDAARHALSRLTRQDLHDRGFAAENRNAGSGSMPGFARYWFPLPSMYGTDPGPPIVDRIALAQILSVLRPSQRRALVELALREDYQAAADALGLTRGGLCARVTEARNAFLALWHEHETPRTDRKTDRRVDRATPRPRVADTLADPERTRQALIDVREAFGAAGVERMHSCDVVNRLAVADPERYGTWDQRDLAFVLRACGVPTQQSININKVTRYGYRLAHITDALDVAQAPTDDEAAERELLAWLAAYLPPEPERPDYLAQMLAQIHEAGPGGAAYRTLIDSFPVNSTTVCTWLRQETAAGTIVKAARGRYVAAEHASHPAALDASHAADREAVAA